jgi:hypothetical protein
MTNNADILVEARAALGDLVEQTPMAPEWYDLETGLQRLTAPPPPRRRRGMVVALGSAVVAFVAIGAVTLLAPSQDPGDTARSSTTAPATSHPPATPTTMVTIPFERVNLTDQIATVTASSEQPGFPAGNLVDGSIDTAWNDAGLHGEGAELTFDFAESVYLDAIVLTNLQNETDRLRNYRIREVAIELRTSEGPVFMTVTAPDAADPYLIDTGTVHRGTLVVRVLSVWPAESVNDMPALDELAIAEMAFFGATIAVEEVEAALIEAKQLIADLDAEIKNLEDSFATAERDVAQELRDRLAAARAARGDAVRQAGAIQAEVDARTDDLAP